MVKRSKKPIKWDKWHIGVIAVVVILAALVIYIPIRKHMNEDYCLNYVSYDIVATNPLTTKVNGTELIDQWPYVGPYDQCLASRKLF